MTKRHSFFIFPIQILQISDIEHLNSTTQSKLNVMKERVTDLEADNIRLRGHIKSLERQNEDLEKVKTLLVLYLYAEMELRYVII